jgi:hypothetical protein
VAGKIFSDIYNEAARQTGDTTTSHITYVKKHVNDALREICSLMNFSWLKKTASLTLVASQQYLTMSDVASDWDVDTPVSIYYRDSANERTELECYDDEEWDDEEDIDEGDVYGFHITKVSGAWRVLFTLVPSSNFVSSYSPLTMRYQKYPTELSADDSVPELPTSQHQGLVYWTNKLICAEMGDDEGFLRWEGLANDSIGLLKKKQVHRLGRPKRVYPRSCLTARGRGFIAGDYNL